MLHASLLKSSERATLKIGFSECAMAGTEEVYIGRVYMSSPFLSPSFGLVRNTKKCGKFAV